MYDKKSKNKEPPRHRGGPSCQINEFYNRSQNQEKIESRNRYQIFTVFTGSIEL